MGMITIIVISAVLLVRLNQSSALKFMEPNESFPALIDQFPKFDFIIHYDNITKFNVDFFLGRSSDDNYPLKLLINYDETSFTSTRPVGHKFINIVYLENPLRFGGRLNLRYNDVVVFILDDLQSFQPPDIVWKQRGLNQAGSVFLCDRISEEFYYVHFYVGGRSGKLNKIQVEETSRMPRYLDYVNTFKNFERHVFNVGHFSCPPFVSNVRCIGPDVCEFEGIDSKILHVMSAHLNFRFRLRITTANEEGKWIAMINDVHSRRLDWAIGGITRTVKRMELVDFTSMLHMESYAVVYAEEKSVMESWDNALSPLNLNVWLGVITLLCFVGIHLKLASCLMDASRKLCDYILMPFQTLTEQPIHHCETPKFCAVKIILAIWFLTSIIITTAYKSKLASSLITTVTEIPDSILDLYKAGYEFQVLRLSFDSRLQRHAWYSMLYILGGIWFLYKILNAGNNTFTESKALTCGNRRNLTRLEHEPTCGILGVFALVLLTDPDDWTVLGESLSEAYDARYRGVLQKTKNDLGFCAAVKKLFHGKFAFVDEETLIQYAIWRRCKQHFNVNEISRLRKVRQKLLPSIHAWPLQQSAPYRSRFSNIFNKLVASGIIEHWYKLNRRFPSTHNKINSANLNALTITTFWGPAFILFAGITLSCVVFLCEHVYAARKSSTLKISANNFLL